MSDLSPVSEARSPDAALVLHGMPDDRLVKLAGVDGPAGLQIIIPGTCDFITRISDDVRRWPNVTLPLPSGKAVRLPRLPMVNHIADPDLHGKSLVAAQELVRRIGLPCFNHPTRVLPTTRDEVARRLAGIAGVTAPATLRLAPKHPRDFAAAVLRAGLRYPVILRCVGTQGGQTQTLIRSEADWDEAFALPWGGGEVYVTEYAEYRDPDGLYRKARIFAIGGEFHLRHLAVSRHWKVHAATVDTAAAAEEDIAMADGGAAFLAPLRPRLEEIERRLGLDYFGIDCSVRPDGSLLLFEVNPTMSFTGADAHASFAKDVVVAQIRRALDVLVRNPARWHDSRGRA
jgi:glutathione synthase/RimK-type ligase-like ATP-grasp enzyme